MFFIASDTQHTLCCLTAMPDYQQPSNDDELAGLYWFTVMLLHRIVSDSLSGSPDRKQTYQRYRQHAQKCAEDHTRLMATKEVVFPIPNKPKLDPLSVANGIEIGRDNFIKYLDGFK